MRSTFDRTTVRIISVTIEPPVSLERRPWPCPLCGRRVPLEDMRSVEVEDVRDGETRRLLVCLDCITERGRRVIS